MSSSNSTERACFSIKRKALEFSVTSTHQGEYVCSPRRHSAAAGGTVGSGGRRCRLQANGRRRWVGWEAAALAGTGGDRSAPPTALPPHPTPSSTDAMEEVVHTPIHSTGGRNASRRPGTGRRPTPMTPTPGEGTRATGIPQPPPRHHPLPTMQTPTHPEPPLPAEPTSARRNTGGGAGAAGAAVEKVARSAAEVKPGELPAHLDLTGPPKCSGCGRHIADRYLNHVLGAFWHAACLTCTECRLPLQKSCFQNEGKLYCGQHFFRRFGTRCRGCGEGIPPSEMVRRAHDNVYHLTCFTCAICGQQLDTGDHFYLRTDHSLVCRADFERARQTCSNATDDDDDNSGDQPSTKRPRASINNKQLEELKNAYNVSRKPSRSLREELGKKLGLDVRVVQVWFQNRRAKEKRLKREVVPTPPFGTHPEGFPVPVSGIEDPDPHLSQGYHGQGKHAMQLPLHDGSQQDFYLKHDGPSAGTEAPSSVSLPNHSSPGCISNLGLVPSAQNTTWSCHPYMDCSPGQRDAFSSPPHHNQYLQGTPGGGGVRPPGSTGEEGISSSFPHTSVHGAVVCTSGVVTPPSGQGMNYENGPEKGWGMQQVGGPSPQVGFSENTSMNGSYQFHNL